MSVQNHCRIKTDSVKREIAKLKQKKQEIKCATRTLALEKNALLNEMSQTTSATMEKVRTSSAIKETVRQMRQVMTSVCSTDKIKKLQLSIAEREKQLACFACNESAIELSADGRRLLINNYTFQMPKSSLSWRTPTSSAPCKGCGQHFPCRLAQGADAREQVIFDISYFIHIFSCHPFMSLDSIEYCHDCKLVFLSEIRLSVHRNEHHPRTTKPTWMTDSTYRNTFGKMTVKISCPACKMSFMAKPNSTRAKVVRPELNFYIHCIEQCPKYRKLNLIAKCNECDKLFLKKSPLGKHISTEHGSKVAGEPVRNWMTNELRKGKRYNLTYNSSKECKGCGKKFPCLKIKSGNTAHIHRSYYIHCIEECEAYRDLGKIFTCAQCGCKFVRKTSHKC